MAVHYPLATETWDEAEYKAIQRVVDSGRFSMGDEVKQFEQAFAKYFGSKYAIMVNSGSSANLLAIAACVYHPKQFLKPGDTVIVPAVSWSTTYYPLQQYGLKLKFIDINPDTLNLDVDLVEKAMTPDVKAVFAVNLLGNPCELDRLNNLCNKNDVILLEDNCESMGATLEGKYAGTYGLCGTFSTFFSHHISTMEGGVIVTDDQEFYHTVLSLRAHGWTREQPSNSHLQAEGDSFSALFRFVLPGYNVRPLEMEGALGQEQLKKLPSLVENRRKNAEIFTSVFANHPDFTIQKETGESSWFGFSLILKNKLKGKRPDLVKFFKENDIECRPIVAGNFLKNPVIKHMDYELGSEIIHADYIDTNGLFLGNHHYDVGEQINTVFDLVRNFK